MDFAKEPVNGGMPSLFSALRLQASLRFGKAGASRTPYVAGVEISNPLSILAGKRLKNPQPSAFGSQPPWVVFFSEY